MTTERFWLITEPARGLSIKVPVPDNMLPNEALEHFVARDGFGLGEAYIEWRRESEMTSLENYLQDATDDTITFIEVTGVADMDPAYKSPGELFEQWRVTREHVADIGARIQDESLVGVPGYIYNGSFYIDEPVGGAGGKRYHLLIEREEWCSDDLDELEHRLFFLFALAEGYEP